MIKELITTIGIITTMGTNPPLKANDGTYYQDVEITETYEYETNEVNSVDDLVGGNIYQGHLPSITDQSFNNKHIELDGLTYHAFITFGQVDYIFDAPNVLSLDFEYFFQDFNNLYIQYNFKNINNNFAVDDINYDIYFYFIYTEGMNINTNDITAFINESDYLGEKTITITPHKTEGLYNLAYHFLVTRIYTNGELANMNVSIFGSTLNINQWLAHTTALAITILLLIVLIKFVIWLFKVVSGTFIWR